MKIFLTVAFLAVTALAQIDPIFKEGCGCCWPLPESCCPETTTTSLPPTTTPTPAPPIPSCDCAADTVVLVDQTGSVEVTELENVKQSVLALITAMGNPGGLDCFKWALAAFARRSPMIVEFGDTASSNIAAFGLAVSGISGPGGQTSIGSALLAARNQFLTKPLTPGANNVVVLITDGGSDNKTQTNERAAKLAADTDARVCVVRMKDDNETGEQDVARATELSDIVANSNPGSELVFTFEFEYGVPGISDLTDLIDCICPATTTTPPIDDTTAPPPPETCEKRDIVFIVDTTGSIVLDELNNVKTTINNYVATLDLDCYRTAVVSFNNTGTVQYDFSDVAATNAGASASIVSAIFGPSGNTGTEKGFVNAKNVLNGRTDTTPCPVVIFIGDGGSDDEATAQTQASSLATTFNPRMCMVQMLDTGTPGTTQAARLAELSAFLAPFGNGSPALFPENFNVPASIAPTVAFMTACVDAVCV